MGPGKGTLHFFFFLMICLFQHIYNFCPNL
jgi:hypothetical protein